MNIVVLGAGLVGSPMAIDLAENKGFNVSVADFSKDALSRVSAKNSKIKGIQRDLSNPAEVTNIVKEFDFVVNAVPGFMGYATAEAIIKAKKDCVCIAFYEEDPFTLDELAKKNDVTMVMDCGVCPGMGGILTMDAACKLDAVDSVIIYVGGLPEIREWPSEYKAVFSPVDVIEEYIRPARYIENGLAVTRPALSDPEMIFYPEIGTLEAFNTDGLRTLAKTIDSPNMKEKTLRYPGHIEKMAVLRDLGFFSKDKTLDVQGVKVSPLEITGRILFPNWQLKKGEVDITIMQTIVEGTKDGQKQRFTFDLFDKYSPETDTHSMARTTGYTATSVLRLIADGLYTKKGISPPEYIGRDSVCVDNLLNQLRQRGVNWVVKQESL
ncbi:MAG: saccharopine dehydrogenase [Spirochaetales bacterium]|nr:saccharopine dehydrogenase [Spirochaetales bacterium]